MEKIVKKNAKRNFIYGMLAGMLLFALLTILMNVFGIRLFSTSSLADNIRNRARVVESYIDRYYWKDDVSDQKIAEYAAKGMVAALDDKYSVYYTDDELDKSLEDVEGDYGGIGATVQADEKTGEKKILEVQKGKPADRAGLKAGDVILKVGDTDVNKLSLSDTVNLIKGEEGKKSLLTISRTEQGKTVTKKITVVCEKIINQTVSYKMLEGSIGYLAITSFNKETVKQYKDALADLEKKGQKGLLVDLRNNGGGSLSAVVDMLDRMLPAGDLIVEKSKVNGDKKYTSTDKEHFDKPVIVLINEGSASASEVFAGCMQDRKAATLVGVKSFGKGIVQTIFSLKDSCGGGIKLTTGEYLLPSGRCIQEKGLTPDVEVKYTGTSKKLAGEDDNQLQKAMEVMKEKIQ